MDWTKKPEYWDDTEWFEKRNQQLVEDKKEGMSIAKMCGKYDITPKRIYTIVENYTNEEE